MGTQPCEAKANKNIIKYTVITFIYERLCNIKSTIKKLFINMKCNILNKISAQY